MADREEETSYTTELQAQSYAKAAGFEVVVKGGTSYACRFGMVDDFVLRNINGKYYWKRRRNRG